VRGTKRHPAFTTNYSSLCDPVTLFLGDGCVNVQHKRIYIRTQLGDDEWQSLHHQAANEMYIAA
jgi:hypothetical protein